MANYNKRAFSRSIDFWRFSSSTDVMILNWPEDVIHLRFGIVQLFISISAVFFFKKIYRGKLVWICHNLISHKKKIPFIQKLTRNFYINKSDFIIVHSKDALKQLEKLSDKAVYLPHPAYKRYNSNKLTGARTDTDVLIWGNILPHKGLDEFVKYYKEAKASFRVLVVGKGEKGYVNSLQDAAEGLNIEIRNEFLSDEELDINFRSSKIVLLPYSKNSATSGALIHSLYSGKIIIGRATGNFVDLHEAGACLIYSNYEDLFVLLSRLSTDPLFYEETLLQLQKGMSVYISCNTWDSFIDKLLMTIE